MYYLNKIVMGLANPMSVALMLSFVALIAAGLKWRRTALVSGAVGFFWLLVWSHPLLMPNMARRMELQFPPQLVEQMPMADAIVILGGGMSKGDGETIYPEMHQAADRVWHAARLWKAGKAPIIFTSGTNEAFASCVLLKDLGVPDSALNVENVSRNTEENAKFVAAYVKSRHNRGDTNSVTVHCSFPALRSAKPRVLLVTSAWHMRRALLTFRKYAEGIEVVPVACDYQALNYKDELDFSALFPSSDCMTDRCVIFKEILGYWGYKLLRR